MITHEIIQGDCIEVLKTLPSELVHCCVTSPPYFGLRDYGVGGQIGLEATPQEFIAAMVTVFEEVRRVLRPDGVLFLNLGDSYAGSNKGVMADGSIVGGNMQKANKGTMTGSIPKGFVGQGFKPKDLMLMPHRVAIALQEAGWWVRSDMPWVKRSAMPESVTDRPARALEYVFMLTKSKRYFYDAEAVRVEGSGFIPGNKTHLRASQETPDPLKRQQNGLVAYAQKQRDRSLPTNRNGITEHLDETPAGSRNFRNADLWFSSIKEPHGLVSLGDELVGLDVNPSGFKDAHFATFPPKLIEPLIKAGTSEHGCCAECGAPWERKVEKELKPTAKASFNPQPDERDDLSDGNDQGSNRMRDGHKPSWFNEMTTTGWQKTCKCETDERVPCTVLDPFTGAGTTLLVSKRLGRRSIGIELNPEYIKIAEHRLAHYHKPQPPPIKQDAGEMPLFGGAE